jgi:hypothetical protein
MTHGRHRLFDAKRRDGWHTYMQGTELRKSWSGSLVQLAMTVGMEAAGGVYKSLTHYFEPNPSPYTLSSMPQTWCFTCRRYHMFGCHR